MTDQVQKIAVITGGSRGLGRNTAESLARKGVDVVITYHSRADEARTVVAAIKGQGRKAVALQLDTGAVGTFDRFAELLRAALRDTWGRDRFDFLINNAGTAHHNSIEKTTEAELDAVYNVHFKGVFFLTQKLLDLLEAAGSRSAYSRVINIGSIEGIRTSHLEAYSYAASKAGVNHLTRIMAKFLAPKHIAVNAIAPGYFPSKMTDAIDEHARHQRTEHHQFRQR